MRKEEEDGEAEEDKMIEGIAEDEDDDDEDDEDYDPSQEMLGVYENKLDSVNEVLYVRDFLQ